MKIKDIEWRETVYNDGDDGDDTLHSYFIDGYGVTHWRITVLDRFTGYGGYVRDIESGYQDDQQRFWLASGNFDIREYPELTIAEAIDLIKLNANTCKGC